MRCVTRIVCLYVDDRATPAQHERLPDTFLGHAGGTSRNNFAAAIADVHAIRAAHIDLGHEPGAWHIGAEGYITVDATQTVPCDETVAFGIPGLDHPGQELRADILSVADASLAWTVHGRCAFATDFD